MARQQFLQAFCNINSLSILCTIVALGILSGLPSDSVMGTQGVGGDCSVASDMASEMAHG